MQRLEATARAFQAAHRTPDRIALFDMAWPSTPEEYQAVGHNAIMQVSVVVGDQTEVPLARVYAHTDHGDVALEQIATIDRPVPADSLTAKTIGTHRQDAYYLLPEQLAHGAGTIMLDFAAKRRNFVLVNLPLDPMPFAPGPGKIKTPDPDAVVQFLFREFPDTVPRDN